MRTLFLPAIALLLFSCQSNEHPPTEIPRTMMIMASGELETPPDMAEFQISISCLKPSVKAARECLQSETDEIFEFLKGLGLEDKDLMTTYVDIHKSYKWQKGDRIFIGYNAATSVNVTLRDLGTLEKVYGKFLEDSDNGIRGLRYTHSKMDSLERAAYSMAMENAEGIAEELLSSMKGSEVEVLKVGNVKITPTDPVLLPGMLAKNDLMLQEVEMEDAAIQVKTGLIQVSSRVYVEFLVH